MTSKQCSPGKKRTIHAYAQEYARQMSDFAADRIAIRCAKKHTTLYPVLFEVRVQVELDHRHLAWSMTMLPGQSVPIQLLDSNQQVILIAGENELLIDSSGLDRTIPIHFLEEASD